MRRARDSGMELIGEFEIFENSLALATDDDPRRNTDSWISFNAFHFLRVMMQVTVGTACHCYRGI
jgi:hypothetical protein